jgi:4-diphosphocytidyl-2-C-methyl-D-erythritol kinase
MRVTIRCPAKVNLFLSVGPKDEIGYHPIRTVFQAIGLFDTLTIESAEGHRITSNWPELPENNTVCKASNLLSEFGDVPPLSIHLEKRIPGQAGLGGGSSDAAGFLRVINHFAPIPFSKEQLHEVARAVGADVPFFLLGGRAMGQGYGDKLTPLEDSAEKWMVIVKPDVSVSTPEAYLALDEEPFPWVDFPLESTSYNDFERVMPSECGFWIKHLELLGAKGAHLCGSGSAVFGMFNSKSGAETANHNLRSRQRIESWVCRTLTRAESLMVGG